MELEIRKESSDASLIIYIFHVGHCRLWVDKNGNIDFSNDSEVMLDGFRINN